MEETVGVGTVILFIISMGVATIIVNSAYQLFMKMMGASGMFFSMKKKLIAIFVVGIVIFGLVGRLFGIGTPR